MYDKVTYKKLKNLFSDIEDDEEPVVKVNNEIDELYKYLNGDKLISGLKHFKSFLGDFTFIEGSVFDDSKKMTDMCNYRCNKTNSLYTGDYTNVYNDIKKLIAIKSK